MNLIICSRSALTTIGLAEVTIRTNLTSAYFNAVVSYRSTLFLKINTTPFIYYCLMISYTKYTKFLYARKISSLWLQPFWRYERVTKFKVGLLSLSVGNQDPRVTQCPIHPKQHLDPFSRCCTVKPRWAAWQTNRLTDWRPDGQTHTSVTIGCISCIACIRCSLMKSPTVTSEMRQLSRNTNIITGRAVALHCCKAQAKKQ